MFRLDASQQTARLIVRVAVPLARRVNAPAEQHDFLFLRPLRNFKQRADDFRVLSLYLAPQKGAVKLDGFLVRGSLKAG